ncbi:FAD/NAD(P)-binding domain-containing protein, partial [Exidia glandulosa HHB12029]
MTPTPKFRVAISGAGPAGLALAATIARFNDPESPVAVDIYESQAEISTVGAGIVVWPRIRLLLEELNLMETLRGELGATQAPGGPKFSYVFRKSDEESGWDFFRYVPPSSPLALHRAALISALQGGLANDPLCTIHTSSRVSSFSENAEGVTVSLANGATAKADLIVGADGVRSAVRAAMFPGGFHEDQRVDPTWTGTVCNRALVTREALERIYGGEHPAMKRSTIYCGHAKHVVAYPIAKGAFVNILAFVTEDKCGAEYKHDNGKWVHDATTDEVVAQFKGWEPEVIALLKAADKFSAWAIHIMLDMPCATIG